MKAWRKRGGGITFSQGEAWADLPVDVPCGGCWGCKVEYAQAWAIRMVHEQQMSTSSCFITLTYNKENLPKPPVLVVADWQTFAKRLRKKIGKFRFFHCGEYGPEDDRPHYHACLFGIDFPDQVFFKWKNGKKIFYSQQLEELWGKGFCTVTPMTYQTANYVAKYCLKKVNGKQKEEGHYVRIGNDDIEYELKPEYCTMSRNPGLGASWIKRFKSDVYPHGYVVYNGKKIKSPTFYDHTLTEEELSALNERRRSAVGKRAEDLTWERLETRERIVEARSKLFNAGR